MNKIFGIALLVIGVILVVYGINGSNSISSNVSQTFTGSPTNKTIWLLISGCAACIVGLSLSVIGFKGPRGRT